MAVRQTSPAPVEENLLGTVLADRYLIRSVLGRGAMSTVYAAWHVGLQCHVAVKVLHPRLVDSDDHVERFEREARSLARLDHPNCLRVLDYGVTEEDLHFLVTELVRGVELRELMTEPMDPRVAVFRIRQVLAGLEHAHACGVIHRDLKPENILVTQTAEGKELLKLVDFGIAKIVGAMPGGGSMAVGVVYGTPQYMSPEQAQGRAVDYRSDLYAAGVLLYAMLAGRQPFDHDDPLEVVEQQIHDPPPRLPGTVPRRLGAIAMRMLHKDPDARFASATEVIAALHEVEPSLRRQRLPRTAGALRASVLSAMRAATRRWRASVARSRRARDRTVARPGP